MKQSFIHSVVGEITYFAGSEKITDLLFNVLWVENRIYNFVWVNI